MFKSFVSHKLLIPSISYELKRDKRFIILGLKNYFLQLIMMIDEQNVSKAVMWLLGSCKFVGYLSEKWYVL